MWPINMRLLIKILMKSFTKNNFDIIVITETNLILKKYIHQIILILITILMNLIQLKILQVYIAKIIYRRNVPMPKYL